MIKKMFQAGMNGVRISTAYGYFAQYQSVIEKVREITDIPIIIDLKRSEIIIKTSQRKVFNKGDILEIGFDSEKFCFNHDIYDQMEVDEEVYIDNGKIRTHVVEKKDRKLRLQTLTNSAMEDGKKINISNKHLSESEECSLQNY